MGQRWGHSLTNHKWQVAKNMMYDDNLIPGMFLCCALDCLSMDVLEKVLEELLIAQGLPDLSHHILDAAYTALELKSFHQLEMENWLHQWISCLR